MQINVSKELGFDEFVGEFEVGDQLLFHNKSWSAIGSKIINFFTGTKLDHVAQIIEVGKGSLGNQYYILAEFKALGGKKIRTFWPTSSSAKEKDDRFDSKHDIYLSKLDRELTDYQKSLLRSFWNDLPDSYSFQAAIGSVNFFDSILSKLFSRLYIKKKNSNFCSGAVNAALAHIGISEKNFTDSMTPDEFARQRFIFEIIKLKLV